MRAHRFKIVSTYPPLKKWDVILFGGNSVKGLVIGKKKVGNYFSYTVYPKTFESKTLLSKIKFFFFRIIVFLRII